MQIETSFYEEEKTDPQQANWRTSLWIPNNPYDQCLLMIFISKTQTLILNDRLQEYNKLCLYDVPVETLKLHPPLHDVRIAE